MIERRTFSIALFLTLAGPMLVVGDTVYIASSIDKRGNVKAEGRVIDFTGRTLEIELSSGQRKEFPADRVMRIETEYDPRQVEADSRFAKGEFDSALQLYGQARTGERRVWVQRQITAQIVWCYRALGRPEQAGGEFLALLLNDPNTLYFPSIPLAWTQAQPSPRLEESAQQWLQREDLPAAVLLGASHLMSTASRSAALARLKQLTTDADSRVAFLATAQTWRAATVTVNQQQLEAWQETIERMPESLRAGPYYVLGLAWAQKQQAEQAALAWLRIPILYPQHRLLAARSLLDAGRSMEKLDRPEQAARFYRELIERYPETDSAAEGRNRMNSE